MQLVLSLVPGGTERLTVELATRLAPRFRMVVCCLNEPGEWAHEVTDRGIPLVTLGRQPGFHPSLGRRVAEVARAHDVRVVHCHHFSPFVYGWIAGAVNRRLRILYTEHGRLSDAPAAFKRRMAHAVLSRLSGHSYAVSHDLRRYLVESGFAPGKIGVIHNGIDPGPLPDQAARHYARAAFGLPADAFVVGTVARLDPVKDLGVAIRAMADVRRTVPQAVLAIAGDGPEQVMHIAQTDVRLIGALGGKTTAPAVDAKAAASKTESMAALRASFAYGEAVIKEFTDQQWLERVNGLFMGASVARLRLAYFDMGHSQDIYGQMAVYLRLNGLVPPASDRP